MSKTKSLLLLLVVAMLLGTALSAEAQNKTGEKKTTWYIHVRNLLTGDMIGDTIKVDLLRPDSTLIFSQPLHVQIEKSTGVPTNYAGFNVAGTNFIVRLSHPDYETALHPIHLNGKKGLFLSEFNVNIRKLTRSEKAIMLGEVVVTASKVELVNKGDTIQFNANAFELAEGSMLDALIRRLPGAELRDNGQIFVNGKFVDKLLLDGKDFFKDDKLVLLQNLPAYTVKNIKVYEEKLPEQLAEKMSATPDYVMDVKLKKEFNAGWMANAEAGGGTHSRYRLRAFGMGYTPKGRISAFAMANNLNESGTPDMSGGWRNTSNTRNEIITKGGGIDYNFEPKPDLSFRGNATVQYITTFTDILSNRQNYISTGDNYTRHWSHNQQSGLNLHTYHLARFPIGKIKDNMEVRFNYGSDKMQENVTEGTFAKAPGDSPSLREELRNGMPENSGILNRYLSTLTGRGKRAEGKMQHQFGLPALGIFKPSVVISGLLDHRWQNADQQYLLQFAGQPEQITRRDNPRSSHGYKYKAGAFAFFSKSSLWGTVSYDLDKSYSKSNTMFYDYLDSYSGKSGSGYTDDWELLEQLRRVLDPRNSYVYGMHTLDHKFGLSLNYQKESFLQNGQQAGSFQLAITPEVRYHHGKMIFNGFNSQTARYDKWLPSANLIVRWWKTNISKIEFNYTFDMKEPEMMDLLDISFNSDPLNPTTGNPNLKAAANHSFILDYNTANYGIKKLFFAAQAAYYLNQNMVQYGTSYDIATGVRTTHPVNVNGNRRGNFMLSLIYTPDTPKRWRIMNYAWFMPSRLVTLLSTDENPDFKQSVSYSNRWQDRLEIEYSRGSITAAARFEYINTRNVSKTQDFSDYTMQQLSAGARALVRLPANFEISTNLNVERRLGYSEPSMNGTQVIWNARISKSILRGSLQFALDGYDMLRQVKRISFTNKPAFRLEECYNSVPSYFMLSIRYFFSKKPRD